MQCTFYRMICTLLAIAQLLINFISPSSATSTDSCKVNSQKSGDLPCPKMADTTERTFIMIKPDGVQRGLVGDIIKRFEQKGFKLVAMKFMQVTTQRYKHNLNSELKYTMSHYE